MSYEQILYDIHERVATITMHRPDRLNAWTPRMGHELYAAFQEAGADTNVRAIVITGAGRGYCAGADMESLRSLQDAEEGEAESAEIAPSARHDADTRTGGASHPALATAYAYPCSIPKPIIAAINGPVAGLGFTHMLYYDIRIASDRARFTTAFARRGLIAEHGSSWMLPRLVGMAHACEILFSGRVFNAEEAATMGLVNRVVPHEQLMTQVYETATELATLSSPRSIGVMKRMLYTHQFTDLAAATSEADEEMLASFPSEDFREGVASFLQKRRPDFTGR